MAAVVVAASRRFVASEWRRQLSCRQFFRTKYTDSKGYTHFRGGRGHNNNAESPQGTARYLAYGAVFSAGAAGIYFKNSEVVPYTKRSHFVLVSPEYDQKLGTRMHKDLLAKYKSAGRLLPQDHTLTRMVRRVGSKIARVTPTLSDWGGQIDHMKKVKWEFNVVDSDEVNAFVLPGGKVVVFRGLFKVLKSENELAMVLAHEISHTIARHSAEKMTQQMTIPLLRFVLFSILGADFAGVPLQLGLELPYSRICENEADEIGLQLMARACFNPRAGPKALSRLSAGNTVPEYLSTHPHSDTRVSKLKSQLPKAIEEYESRCHATRSFFSQSLNSSPLF